MVAEVDGMRLITGSTMSLFRRVPDVLVQVRKCVHRRPLACVACVGAQKKHIVGLLGV